MKNYVCLSVRSPTCKSDENKKLHSNHGNGFKSARASVKICERHFYRFCGNNIVFSASNILIGCILASIVTDMISFDAIKTDYQRILLASSL